MPRSQFASGSFTILVGPAQQEFTAHRDILSKSPKLKVQCNDERYLEASSKKIELLDQDPATFALLLEYLYTGDYWPKLGEAFPEPKTQESRFAQVQLHAKLYTMAGYNQLWDLQKLAVEKIKDLFVAVDDFLPISQYIYNNNQGAGPYREYFRYRIVYCHIAFPEDVKEWTKKRIAEGGELAEDLYLTQCEELEKKEVMIKRLEEVIESRKKREAEDEPEDSRQSSTKRMREINGYRKRGATSPSYSETI